MQASPPQRIPSRIGFADFNQSLIASRTLPPAPPKETHASNDAPPANVSDVEKYLRDIEMPESLVRECLEVVAHVAHDRTDPFDGLVMDKIAEYLMSHIRTQPLLEKATTHSTIALVGATGVGKTTTIAKLAAYSIEKFKNRSRSQVSMAIASRGRGTSTICGDFWLSVDTRSQSG